MAYRVIAPYVTLKVKDPNGVYVVSGFYQGGIVSLDIEPENLQHHLDRGLLEEATVSEDGIVEDGEADLGPSGAQAPSGMDRLPGSPGSDDESDDEAPAGNASTEDWLAYAKTRDNWDEADAELGRDDLRDKYGA